MNQVVQGADQVKLACCVRTRKRCLLVRQNHDGALGVQVVQEATNNQCSYLPSFRQKFAPKKPPAEELLYS